MNKTVLWYTVTDNPQALHFAEHKLDCIRVGLELTKEFQCKILTVIDNKNFTIDKRIKSAKINTGAPGLNGAINMIIHKYAQKYDYILRVDDTDTFVFPDINKTPKKRNLEADIIVYEKIRIANDYQAVDTASEVENWLRLCECLLRKPDINSEDITMLNTASLNGAGCLVSTIFLRSIEPFPEEIKAGDDLWLFLNASRNNAIIEHAKQPVYIYEKIKTPVKSKDKIILRNSMIRKFLSKDE